MNNIIKWVPKGWGGEKWIVNNDMYCGKILHIVKGHKLSLHYHKIKDETFYVQDGNILLGYYYVKIDDREYVEIDRNGNPYQPSKHKLAQLDYEFEKTAWSALLGALDGKKWCPDLEHKFLSKGDSFHVPVGTRHFLYAIEDSNIIEFSTHHEDSDSYRILKGD